jgi:tRNA (mo5U34)-methyltransferase
MSARGAREVLAIDILDPLEWDWPVGSDAQVVAEVGRRKRGGVGFTFVGRALDSDIECRELSVYDLDPNLVGTFDFVYLGSVLLHLRDPIRALERIRSVLNPDGRLLVVDAIDKELTIRHPRRPIAELDGDGRPWWWKPNLAGLGRMVSAAGFDLLTKPKTIYLKPGRGQPLPGWKPTLLRNAAGRELLLTKWRGDAHASVLAARRPG